MGGGFVLNALNCKERVGIEINPYVKTTKSLGIQVVDPFNNLNANKFDVAISNSALEHVDDPLNVLINIHRVLKQEGNLYFLCHTKIYHIRFIKTI